MRDLKSRLHALDRGRSPAATRSELGIEALRARLERIEGRRQRVDSEEGRQPPLSEKLGGVHEENAHGRFLKVRNRYHLSFRHGRLALNTLWKPPAPETHPLMGTLPGACGARGFLFLDTETTGLSGGSGTMAFLIGVGWLDACGFRIEQYFAEDPSQEAAMLAAVEDRARGFDRLVTYNGKTFDLPLLSTRHILNFRRDAWRAWSDRHLDLFPLARRLWRGVYEDCRLKTLEARILGVEREDDVDGSEIPGLYFNYVQQGDARRLDRVFYHNELDLLSLAGLLAAIGEERDGRAALRESPDARALANLSRAFLRSGDTVRSLETAEASLKRTAMDCDVLAQWTALKELARHHKRVGREEESVALWERMIVLRPEGLHAYEELAKYHEHRQSDPTAALGVVCRALERLPGPAARESLQRRRNRLERKQRGGRS